MPPRAHRGWTAGTAGTAGPFDLESPCSAPPAAKGAPGGPLAKNFRPFFQKWSGDQNESHFSNKNSIFPQKNDNSACGPEWGLNGPVVPAVPAVHPRWARGGTGQPHSVLASGRQIAPHKEGLGPGLHSRPINLHPRACIFP